MCVTFAFFIYIFLFSERGSYMQFTQCSNIHFGNTYSLSNTMYISKSAQDVNKHNTPEGTCESDLPQYVQGTQVC